MCGFHLVCLGLQGGFHGLSMVEMWDTLALGLLSLSRSRSRSGSGSRVKGQGSKVKAKVKGQGMYFGPDGHGT